MMNFRQSAQSLQRCFNNQIIRRTSNLENMNTSRRYDIDWLRVIAIGLLLIYHIAIVFQPWGVFIAFITSKESLESIWIPMSLLNVWRIPLLFFVSGMGVCLAMKKRNWKQLIGERSLRIFLPYIAGIFLIVPLHLFIFQDYYGTSFAYSPNPGHLWFLGNIFSYVLILIGVFYLLKHKENNLLKKGLQKLYSNPLSLLLIAILFIIETLLTKPADYAMYAMTAHGFWLGLLAFWFGFTFIYTGDVFWKTVLKWKWLYLGLGIVLFTIRYWYFNLKAPDFLIPIETVAWILAIFGFGHQYLNKGGKVLSYLSEAAYPVYIIHMAYLYLGAYLILPLEINIILKFILVNLFTAVACLVTYELIIKRVFFLRPLFGLKVDKPSLNKLKLSSVR